MTIFSISEDHKLDSVPGTGLLSAKLNQATVHEARELKRGTGKHSHIVLIPQPSDDPRDPYVVSYTYLPHQSLIADSGIVA